MRARSAIPIDSKRALAALRREQYARRARAVRDSVHRRRDHRWLWRARRNRRGSSPRGSSGSWPPSRCCWPRATRRLDKRRWSLAGVLAFIRRVWTVALEPGLRGIGSVFLVARGVVGVGRRHPVRRLERPGRANRQARSDVRVVFGQPHRRLDFVFLGPANRAGVVRPCRCAPHDDRSGDARSAPIIAWTPDPATAKVRGSLESSNAHLHPAHPQPESASA